MRSIISVNLRWSLGPICVKKLEKAFFFFVIFCILFDRERCGEPHIQELQISWHQLDGWSDVVLITPWMDDLYHATKAKKAAAEAALASKAVKTVAASHISLKIRPSTILLKVSLHWNLGSTFCSCSWLFLLNRNIVDWPSLCNNYNIVDKR